MAIHNDSLITSGSIDIERLIYDTVPNNIVFLNEGTHVIKHYFNGKHIYDVGLSRNYTVELILLDEDSTLVDYRPFNTSFYNYMEFQGICIEITNISDHGEDINGDSLFDYLIIQLESNIVRDGNFGIEGSLYVNDTFIDSATNYTYLNQGLHEINLSFDGLKIRKKKLDGPYVLDLIISDKNYREDIEYNTSFYSFTRFDLPASRFTNNYFDYGIDNNADGFYDYLVVEAELSIAIPANYSVIGKLYDNDGNEIAWTYKDSQLDAGLHSIPLNFDGLAIFKHGVNGPYSLSVSLFGEDGTKIDYQDSAYTTAPYSYMQFQKPLVQFSGKYNDYGVDEDSDGLYDYLVIEAELNVGESGNYSGAAWLYANETVIVKISGSGYLGKGIQTIDLVFDGVSIYEKGIDGPYTLMYFTLRDENGSLVNYGWNIYNTSAYNYTEFQRGELIGDANNDSKVDIFDLAMLCSHWLQQD